MAKSYCLPKLSHLVIEFTLVDERVVVVFDGTSLGDSIVLLEDLKSMWDLVQFMGCP